MDDATLVRAAKQGDAQAFERLYYRYRDWVVSLAFRFCRNRDDALDVLQETFAYFYRKLPEFELRAHFKTFLYPVVKHLALDRTPSPRAELLDLPAREGGGEEARELLACLPDVQREVVWMRFVDEMDLRDIAEALQIPLGTVKSRLHAAIETLKKSASHRTF